MSALPARVIPMRNERPEEQPPVTEFDLAAQFREGYADIYRHTPGMGWMTFPTWATHWQRDDQMRRFHDAKQVAQIAASAADRRSECKSLASAKTVAAIIQLAASDPDLSVPAGAWDADAVALNTPLGIVDLRTGKRRTRSPTDYVTQCTRVDAEQGPSPTWDRFLEEVFLGDHEVIDFVQRLCGYCLTGDRREQILVFCYGLGANGKSTFWDVVMYAIGTYALKLPAHVLMQSQLQAHPTELAQLHRVRLALSSELEEGQYWAEARIKELTGDEVLRARYMRQDYFEFSMTQKHVIVGNFKPRLKGGDQALARRFVLLPFRARFAGLKRDSSMLDKLRAEAPAILAWAIAGAVKWYAMGLAVPASVAAASAEYMHDHDDLALWVEERCALVPDARTQASVLYEDYVKWLRARGQQPPSLRLFADRLGLQDGVRKVKSHGVIVYVGIGLLAAV